MNHPIKTKGVAVVVAMLASVLIGGTRAGAQIATFENFSEGFLGPRFVDPASGIIFTNAVYNFPNGGFSIDYGALTNSPVLPGNHLTGNAYSPGASIGLTGGFGFTFILPTPSTTVQMDEIYFSSFGNSWTIAVTAYATNGQMVLQTNVSLPNTFPQMGVAHSIFQSAIPMGRVTVTTPSNSSIGFDNIGAPIAPPVTGPTLRMVRSEANATAVLFWPTNEAGFTLQSTTNLSPPITWASDLPAPSVVGGQYRVTVSFGGARRFFRLHKP